MKVVLAYSGGLDTTVLLAFSRNMMQRICYCSNVGQMKVRGTRGNSMEPEVLCG